MVSSTIIYSKYYRKSRLNEFEPKIRNEFDARGIQYVFIRPTMIFGTPNDGNISTFIRWFNKYPIFPIIQHGEATIQPVSRLDLAEAYYLILKNIDRLKSKDYIVSGRDEMTLMEMFNIIAKENGHPVRFFNVPTSIAKICVDLVYALSNKKIDYREKLQRLTEDRAYSHDLISNELGYEPLSFQSRVRPLVEETLNQN